MRRAARKDGNHGALVRYAKGLGFSVLELYQLPGALDCLVGLYRVDQLVEIKDPAQDPNKRALTNREAALFETWKGRRPIVWETTADVDETYRRILCEVAP